MTPGSRDSLPGPLPKAWRAEVRTSDLKQPLRAPDKPCGSVSSGSRPRRCLWRPRWRPGRILLFAADVAVKTPVRSAIHLSSGPSRLLPGNHESASYAAPSGFEVEPWLQEALEAS